MQDSVSDESFMRHALELAFHGAWHVSPNPLVGALVVCNGRIIGEGWHTAFGLPHAEREALADCAARGEDALVRGATMYVTLEPCCHTGKTPPCTDALIEAGISRVVVGAPDPNPLVAGKGCAALREAGIDVVEGVLQNECAYVNEAFFHYIRKGRPLVLAKYAMTLDGKVATREHRSRWITGSLARRRVHEDRRRFAAIMVGVGTVIADDPLLTCRLEEFERCEGDDCRDVDDRRDVDDCQDADDRRNADACDENTIVDHGTYGHGTSEPGTYGHGTSGHGTSGHGSEGYGGHGHEAAMHEAAMNGPTRIICDSHLRTPPGARVVATAHEVPTLLATCVQDEDAYAPYLVCGCEIVSVASNERGDVDLKELVDALTGRGIDGIIVEGGPTLLGAAFDAGIVDKVQAYIAPKVFGGVDAPSPVAGAGVAAPSDAMALSEARVTMLGGDMLVECGVV